MAGSVKADSAITNAANQQAAALNSNTTLRNDLIAMGTNQLNPSESEDVTLYTQTYLSIEATNLTKDDSSNVTSITLNITPMVQVVASTAGHSASVDLTQGTGNAVVVQNAAPLTINDPTEITVQLPADSFGGKTVYVAHEKYGGTYYYQAETDENGQLTFTSQHGFSPFTFSLTNEAIAQVGDVGYSSLQDTVNDAGANTVTVLETGLSANVNRDVTLENGTNASLTVTINGQEIQIAANQTYKYEYTAVNIPDSYPINVADAANGSVDTNLSNASRGNVITITATPDEGYVVGSVVVTGPNGRVDVERVNDTTYTFVMPDGEVDVSVTFVSASAAFTDVNTGDWFYEYVQYVVANGLMEGVSDTEFAPNATMSRAMVWTIMARIDGQTVTGANWVDTARAWAMANGVSDGTDPNGDVTREQLATMLWRYAGEPASEYSLAAFTDASSVSEYAATAMAWAVENGIITGMTDMTLAPQGTATRAQCAAMLMRYVENV